MLIVKRRWQLLVILGFATLCALSLVRSRQDEISVFRPYSFPESDYKIYMDAKGMNSISPGSAPEGSAIEVSDLDIHNLTADQAEGLVKQITSDKTKWGP